MTVIHAHTRPCWPEDAKLLSRTYLEDELEEELLQFLVGKVDA